MSVLTTILFGVASLVLNLETPDSTPSFTTLEPDKWPQLTAINDAPFAQEAFAGNAFLLSHKGHLYAVTAKHIFILIKNETTTSISLSDTALKQWTMHPQGDREHAITLGRLRNSNTDEPIDFHIIEKDWLFFDVKKNRSNLLPLRLRSTPLRPGERVFIAGCPYLAGEKCRQNVYPGKFVVESGSNILLDMDSKDTTAHRFTGLSGAPVLDTHGDVVGIVSTEKPNPNGPGTLYAPASVNYAIETLDALK